MVIAAGAVRAPKVLRDVSKYVTVEAERVVRKNEVNNVKQVSVKSTEQEAVTGSAHRLSTCTAVRTLCRTAMTASRTAGFKSPGWSLPSR